MGSANHNSGESGEWQMMNFQSMPLLKRAAPFDALKLDGIRFPLLGLARSVPHARCGAEHCFRLSSQNRKELHIRNPQKNP